MENFGELYCERCFSTTINVFLKALAGMFCIGLSIFHGAFDEELSDTTISDIIVSVTIHALFFCHSVGVDYLFGSNGQ